MRDVDRNVPDGLLVAVEYIDLATDHARVVDRGPADGLAAVSLTRGVPPLWPAGGLGSFFGSVRAKAEPSVRASVIMLTASNLKAMVAARKGRREVGEGPRPAPARREQLIPAYLTSLTGFRVFTVSATCLRSAWAAGSAPCRQVPLLAPGFLAGELGDVLLDPGDVAHVGLLDIEIERARDRVRAVGDALEGRLAALDGAPWILSVFCSRKL